MQPIMFDRIRFFGLIKRLEGSGAHVAWDDDIGEHEGGFADAETGEYRRGAFARLIFGTPNTIFFWHMFKGSEFFTSPQLKQVLRLPKLNRVAVAGLPVNLEDIKPLLRRQSLKSIGLYETGLAEDEIECLKNLAGNRIRIDINTEEA